MLELNPSLMLIVLIVFVGLIFYLNKVLYQPLLHFMDQRDLTLVKDLQEVTQLESNAEHLFEEANSILDKAKQEALTIRQTATNEANSEAAKLIEAKEAELEKAYEEFKRELEKEKEEVKNSILSQVPLIKEAIKAKFAKL
ncbi:MAG: F0F1 ATP synthase subunit B' [Epsilonproteobacteria bacterium]|nr:F0F1 ATP synthase subunit B' [Campylobacterota bacterium]